MNNKGIGQGRRIPRLLFWLAVVLSMLAMFVFIFHVFELVSLQAILTTNAEFAHHTATIAESFQSLVRTTGTQIYYISSTNRLRTSQMLSTFDRIYALRELGQYVSASSMLQSIYVFNDEQSMVFSTDELLHTAPYASFADQSALSLYQERSRENRAQLSYRIIRAAPLLPHPRSSWSFQVFETNAAGEPQPGAVMLNIDPQWFRDSLLTFPGESYILLDQRGRPVAAQSDDLPAKADHFLPLVRKRLAEEGKAGYLQVDYQGERTLCFYTLVEPNAWLNLRIMRYEDQLPGLYVLRNRALLVFGLSATLLMAALVFSFLRIYAPFSSMRSKLAQNVAASPVPVRGGKVPVQQLDSLLATSRHRQEQQALHQVLRGDMALAGQLPPPPGQLLLIECGEGQLAKMLPAGALQLPHDLGTLVLLTATVSEDGLAIAQRIGQAHGCRCYYTQLLHDWQMLPTQFQHLRELQQLRLFYPGQRVFSATLLASHRGPEDYPAQDAADVMTALRGDDLQQVRTSFLTFMERLRTVSYVYLRYALNHLLEQVQDLAPRDMNPPMPVIEEVLREAEDTQALLEALSPFLFTIASHQAQQRKEKVSAVAEQVALRLSKGYREPGMSAQRIADEIGISSSYLRKQFYDTYQRSVAEYLNHIRIDKAKELLCTTDLTVDAIAGEIGIDNTKYLFVLFKRIVGMTPGQYRREGEER